MSSRLPHQSRSYTDSRKGTHIKFCSNLEKKRGEGREGESSTFMAGCLDTHMYIHVQVDAFHPQFETTFVTKLPQPHVSQVTMG